MTVNQSLHNIRLSNFAVTLELLKPITWFPPMWAFLCGIVATGVDISNNIAIVILGIILAGPIICGMSQAINDWGDQTVDAINEPSRPIPSGRISSMSAVTVAILLSIIGLIIGWSLGKWVFAATLFAVFCAWAYSVEPTRLKKSGVFGPAIVAICYEGVPWFTGSAVMMKAVPSFEIIIIASLYAFGAFGIMTLNDFKALKGDRITGIKSLPVILGAEKASKIACLIMTLPQLIVILLLYYFGALFGSSLITILLFVQLIFMKKLVRDPERLAPWYNGTGVALYVSGMMISAIALRGVV